MSRIKAWCLFLAAAILVAVSVVEILAETATQESAFSIRKVEGQVVLYTIHRGSYDKAGSVIGKLFALAGQKGIRPQGGVTFTYLNNPTRVSSEHWLTEIRIPVGEEALKLAGTLGEFTDVKTVPAAEVAVAIKPEGLADPGPLYVELTAWIFRQGYAHTDDPSEAFLTSAMGGDYSQMKTEIMIPIEKLAPHKD